MSREELEKRALEARYNLVSSKDKETIDILEELAIKALEQEPMLDKARTEITQLPTSYVEIHRAHSTVERHVVEVEAVIRVIDKLIMERGNV